MDNLRGIRYRKACEGERVQCKVKTDVREEQRKEGNLPDIELHQLHGHTLTESFHGKLGGSVNVIEYHS